MAQSPSKKGEAVHHLNWEEVQRQRIPHAVARRFGIDTSVVGADTGSPDCSYCKPPDPFAGIIKQLDIRLDDPGESIRAEKDAIQARFNAGNDY